MNINSQINSQDDINHQADGTSLIPINIVYKRFDFETLVNKFKNGEILIEENNIENLIYNIINLSIIQKIQFIDLTLNDDEKTKLGFRLNNSQIDLINSNVNLDSNDFHVSFLYNIQLEYLKKIKSNN